MDKRKISTVDVSLLLFYGGGWEVNGKRQKDMDETDELKRHPVAFRNIKQKTDVYSINKG